MSIEPVFNEDEDCDPVPPLYCSTGPEVSHPLRWLLASVLVLLLGLVVVNEFMAQESPTVTTPTAPAAPAAPASAARGGTQ